VAIAFNNLAIYPARRKQAVDRTENKLKNKAPDLASLFQWQNDHQDQVSLVYEYAASAVQKRA